MASPIKRNRKTKRDIKTIREGLFAILENDYPQTVRGIFYQAVSRGLVEKTEPEYKGTVCRLLGEMREAGELPFRWIADNTRWMRKPDTYGSLVDMLENSAAFYRRAVWQSQRDYIEIWLEKDALAGVFSDVTYEYDVPLMVTRGYPSTTYIFEAAEEIDRIGKPTFIYYFGDRDPSGVNIYQTVERKLQKWTSGKITFTHAAVTPEQIDEYDLPTRPTKKTDSRAKKFKGESVELDAIPARELRLIVETCILNHIDTDALKGVLMAEEQERKTLEMLAANFTNL